MTPKTQDRIVELDSEMGKKLGFTSDLFDGWLWERGEDIYISFIMSNLEGKGNLRKLIDRVLSLHFNVKVPTPSNRMLKILIRGGFKRTVESAEEFGDGEICEVWVKNHA